MSINGGAYVAEMGFFALKPKTLFQTLKSWGFSSLGNCGPRY